MVKTELNLAVVPQYAPMQLGQAHAHYECLTGGLRGKCSMLFEPKFLKKSKRANRQNTFIFPDVARTRTVTWDASVGFEVVFDDKKEAGFVIKDFSNV